MLKEITTVIKENEEQILRSIISIFKKNFSGFEVYKYKKGKLGDEFIITFKVDKDYYGSLIQKLAYNDIRIFRKDAEAKQIVEEVKNQKRKAAPVAKSGWDSIRTKQKTITEEDLEELAVDGKYKEILDVIKNSIRHPLEIVKKAKALLSDSIAIALNRAYSNATENKDEAKKEYKVLLNIATDKQLKLNRLTKELKEAGYQLIELCIFYPEFFKNLIDIANNSNLHPTINIKAAVELGDKFLSDEEKYAEEIALAVKNLNTRWLNNAFEIAIKDLSNQEIDTFKKLVRFIEGKRNN